MTDEKSTKRDLAEKLLQKGKYDEAIVLLEDIHQESPDEDPVLLMLAWAYYDSGKTGQAEKCLTILFDRELERKVFTGFAF
ncbi:MAG TPA: tetratricopeptide repeat protein, partial [Smithella sp.]|nr:tetratricopeptide repeat protein [Smithella sp.]